MTRLFFGALAAGDALLLFYLVVAYGWFNLTVPNISESIASVVIVPLLWGMIVADRVFAVAVFAAMGAGIWKDIAGRERPRWLAILTTPVLIIALAAIGFAWIAIVTGIVSKPPGFIHDRLTLFDALAMRTRVGDIEMLGAVSYASQSFGRFLIHLIAVAYLLEKYLVQSWRVRWPVPILPLMAIGWVGWTVSDGERRLRDVVA